MIYGENNDDANIRAWESTQDNTNNTGVDLYGNEIVKGDNVVVPDPNDTDIHQHSFVGYVLSISDAGICTIEDSEGDCFDIEDNRLEVEP